jgi:hypothetical protein
MLSRDLLLMEAMTTMFAIFVLLDHALGLDESSLENSRS